MKNILFIVFVATISYGQEIAVKSEQLSESAIDTIFSSEVKDKYNITFDVYRAYSYNDKKGSHLLLMTHNPTKKTNTAFIREHTDGVYHDSIKAYFFDKKGEELKLKKMLTDFADKNEHSEEFSIAFWTKFFALDDYDGNGTIDPILIYGTYGSNGTGNGRIKIMILQNGQKIALRHQNGILDGERITKIDPEFYNLPNGIQQQVIKQMQAITDNNSGIFAGDWKQAMKDKKVILK